jgi:hypothetical protein
MKVILTMIIICVACISCRRPDSAPELRDPTYLDIQDRISYYEKELKAVSDERPKIEEGLKTINQQSGEYKMAWKEYYRNEKAIHVAEQKLLYFKMASDSRKKQARLSYLEYYQKNKENEWPDPNDFARYKSRIENTDFFKKPE